MQYQILEQRLQGLLQTEKMNDPQHVCDILKGELEPIISNYITLREPIAVRFKKLDKKLLFSVEIDADRVRPFGYLPK